MHVCTVYIHMLVTVGIESMNFMETNGKLLSSTLFKHTHQCPVVGVKPAILGENIFSVVIAVLGSVHCY